MEFSVPSGKEILSLKIGNALIAIHAQGLLREIIAEEWANFLAGPIDSKISHLGPNIEISGYVVHADSTDENPRIRSVRGIFGFRRVVYTDGSQITSREGGNGTPRRIEISAPHIDRLHELIHLALLSSTGEINDLQGLVRIHGLGISAPRKGGKNLGASAGVLLLPSGGGKSSIAQHILDNKESSSKIFSDESPWLDGKNIHPFPMRRALVPPVARSLGLSEPKLKLKRALYPEKWLFPIPENRIAETQSLTWMAWGKPVEGFGAPKVTRRSRPWFGLRLFPALVLGLGIAQIAELMLRFSSNLHLPRILIIRVRLYLQIIFGQVVFLEVRFDPKEKSEIENALHAEANRIDG